MHAIMKFSMRRGDREVGTQKILQLIVDADFVNLALFIFTRAKHVILTVQGQSSGKQVRAIYTPLNPTFI